MGDLTDILTLLTAISADCVPSCLCIDSTVGFLFYVYCIFKLSSFEKILSMSDCISFSPIMSVLEYISPKFLSVTVFDFRDSLISLFRRFLSTALLKVLDGTEINISPSPETTLALIERVFILVASLENSLSISDFLFRDFILQIYGIISK